MKAGTEKNELHQVSDCESVCRLPPETPLQAAQMMRDKIVRRLSRPRARALEMAYPAVRDDKTFRPISLAAR